MTTHRSNFRVTLLCLAIAALGLAFTGCVNAPAAKETTTVKVQTPAAKYNPGVYTATANGIGGQIVVQVTFSATAITDIKVLSDNESPEVGEVAIKELPGKIVAGQTLTIDAVSGATTTSEALFSAVEECVKKAGGNVSALEAK